MSKQNCTMCKFYKKWLYHGFSKCEKNKPEISTDDLCADYVLDPAFDYEVTYVDDNGIPQYERVDKR